MDETSLLQKSPTILNTFRYFAVLSDHLGKKGKKQEYYKSDVGVRENMMDGTHFSSYDLKLAQEKVGDRNTAHKFEFTLQGKRLLRGFFNRNVMAVFTQPLVCLVRSACYLVLSPTCITINSDSVSEINNFKNYSFIVTFK